MKLPALLSLPVLLSASVALALVPMPADAGDDAGSGRPAPPIDASIMPPEPAGDAATPDPYDGGGYLDSGCADGACELVLPDWDGGDFDAGPLDTGQRRRRTTTDAGTTEPPEEGGFGCSAGGGASSLLWLLPFLARRRRS